MRAERLLLVFLLVASACVRAEPGVDVANVSTQIVFGANEIVSRDIAPPGFNPPRAAPPVRFGTLPKRSLPPLQAPPRVECPDAPLTAVPREEVSEDVDELPAEGRYRWQRSGEVRLAGAPFPFPIEGFETRVVREASEIFGGARTFQTVQTDELFSPGSATKEIVVSTWEVRTSTASTTVSFPGVVSQRVTQPEGGVTLVRLERFAQDGTPIGTFEPNPGVLYLPLPVLSGETYTSQGVDPTTGDQLQHQAQVLRRERIDACGELVDGWLVESTQQFVGSQTSTREYDYIVAPQLGGLVISERIQVTQGTTQIDSQLRLGQVEPDALRDEDRA